MYSFLWAFLGHVLLLRAYIGSFRRNVRPTNFIGLNTYGAIGGIHGHTAYIQVLNGAMQCPLKLSRHDILGTEDQNTLRLCTPWSSIPFFWSGFAQIFAPFFFVLKYSFCSFRRDGNMQFAGSTGTTTIQFYTSTGARELTHISALDIFYQAYFLILLTQWKCKTVWLLSL